MRRGELVLPPGASIRAIEIALLCEVGSTSVQVIPCPTVAVLPTGNELLDPADPLSASGIRNSNGPMLAAAVAQAGGIARNLGVARDDAAELRSLIAAGLEADILVLSGGVSEGVLDLVPGVLAELGVREVFHKVHLKPGKPIWFGTFAADGMQKLVFGLPGNPVSSLVCFELFVRPAIQTLAGRGFFGLPRVQARLSQTFVLRGNRPTYQPAVLHGLPDNAGADGPLLSSDAGSPTVEPLKWQGSADIRTLARSNALACFPTGDRSYAAGETLEVLLLDRTYPATVASDRIADALHRVQTA
jgi:molybdopterin molybdotransferase